MKIILCFYLLITIFSVIESNAQTSNERAESLNKLKSCVADSMQCEDLDKAVKVLITLFEKGNKELAKPLVELSLSKITSLEHLEFYWKIYRDNTDLFLSVIADKKPHIQRQYIEIASFYAFEKEIKELKKKLQIIVEENSAFAQVANLGLQEIERTSKPYFFSGFEYPIFYGKKDDGFPDVILIDGTIVEASLNSRMCGTMAFAGTMKIRLDKKIEGYNNDFVYVLVTCFFDEEGKERYLNKCVKFKVNKLYEENYQFSASLSNNSDSKGIPFYETGYFGEDNLYEKIKCN